MGEETTSTSTLPLRNAISDIKSYTTGFCSMPSMHMPTPTWNFSHETSLISNSHIQALLNTMRVSGNHLLDLWNSILQIQDIRASIAMLSVVSLCYPVRQNLLTWLLIQKWAAQKGSVIEKWASEVERNYHCRIWTGQCFNRACTHHIKPPIHLQIPSKIV